MALPWGDSLSGIKRIALLVVLFCSFSLARAGDAPLYPQYYDELRGAEGKIRPQYEKVYSIYKKLSHERKVRFDLKSKELFSESYSLDPLPRILLDTEVKELTSGIQQRGRALRLFLEDYYAGGNRYETVLPKPVLDRIVTRTGDLFYRERFKEVKSPTFSFPYGPDVIRDSQGMWRVLEDNTGYIGGPGDLVKGREILFELLPEYREVLSIHDNPREYFEKLADRYRKLAKPSDGKVVLYSLPRSEISDKEDLRLRKILQEQGIDFVTPGTRDRELVSAKEGVFLEKRLEDGTRTKERIGFLILNGDHKDLDSGHWLIQEAKWQLSYDKEHGNVILPSNIRAELESAVRREPESGLVNYTKLKDVLLQSEITQNIPKSRRTRTPGILDAILDGRVASNYTPGVDFIGDKEFNAYVDGLVKVYTGEEPILRSVPSRSFLKNGEVDKKLMEEVFSHQNQYVIKVVDGRGGDGIWVGPNVSASDFEKAKKYIIESPERYRAQEFKHLSVLGDKLVDLRGVSFVHPEGVDVSETLWGRSVSIKGDGKANISAHGMESPVVVVNSQALGAPCARTMLEPHLSGPEGGRLP